MTSLSLLVMLTKEASLNHLRIDSSFLGMTTEERWNGKMREFGNASGDRPVQGFNLISAKMA